MSIEKITNYSLQIAMLKTNMNDLEENKSFVIPKDWPGLVLTFNSIKLYLTSISKKELKFVVTENPEQFIIFRLTDNASCEEAYRQSSPVNEVSPSIDMDNQVDYIRRLLNRYQESTQAKANKMSSNITHAMFSDCVIPYSYIQRNTSTVSMFKKDVKGSTNALKAVISHMVGANDIEKVEKPDMYGTHAALFKILRKF